MMKSWLEPLIASDKALILKRNAKKAYKIGEKFVGTK